MLSDGKIIFSTEQRKTRTPDFNWGKLDFMKQGNKNLSSLSLSLSPLFPPPSPRPPPEVGVRRRVSPQRGNPLGKNHVSIFSECLVKAL